MAIEGSEGDLGPTPLPSDVGLFRAFLPAIFYYGTFHTLEAEFGIPPAPLTPQEIETIVSRARALGVEVDIPTIPTLEDVTPDPSLGSRAPKVDTTAPSPTFGGLVGIFGGPAGIGNPAAGPPGSHSFGGGAGSLGPGISIYSGGPAFNFDANEGITGVPTDPGAVPGGQGPGGPGGPPGGPPGSTGAGGSEASGQNP
jgi:hypothetical protein